MSKSKSMRNIQEIKLTFMMEKVNVHFHYFSHCTFVFKLVLWLIPCTRTIRREADKTNSGTYRLSDVSVIMDEEKMNWVVYNKD